MRATIRLVVIVAVLTSAGAALADERTWIVRSEESAATPPDPAVCAAAPFATNVQLGAELWSLRTEGRSGSVEDPARRVVGRATACLQLTSLLFSPGLTQLFYVRFDLPEGSFAGVGSCRISTNDVPVSMLVLAGCTLELVEGPPGMIGGVATSASIFNPTRVPGYGTGSFWTLHTYFDGAAPAPHGRRDHDDGPRGHD